jgi:tetratricopeptide (TPR) repeat protein
MKKLGVLLIVWNLVIVAKAEKVFEFNSTCQQAYQEITRLKLNNGLLLLEKAKKQNPDNLIPVFLENYIDFFILFFNEDAAEYKVKKPIIDQRIEQLKSGPESSPFYNFCLSFAYCQKAVMAIKFGENLSAGLDFRKSYQYIKSNQKQFPTFTPNQLLYGGLETIIGTIPKGYKWLTSLLGMKGSVEEGMRTLKNFTYSNDPYARLMNTESSLIYGFLLFHIENKKEEALQFIKDRKLDVVNNHLFTFMAANLSKNGRQTEAAKTILLNRNHSPEYMQSEVWDYEMGYCRLHHLELPDAILHFETFVTNFKGKFYVKDVYQKLSWCFYLQGNYKAAEAARQQILSKGNTLTEADKLALKEARNGKWPNALLLRARMLSDGGYDLEASRLLSDKTLENFNTDEDKLEFLYRQARISDDMKKENEAIQKYLIIIQLGENRTEYYAARSALQIGLIYEHRGNKEQAISYYKKCLNMEDHDFKNSLDQKAKAGIARCKGE